MGHIWGGCSKILLPYKISFMESTQLVQSKAEQNMTEEEFDRSFQPKGAIAFFVLLIILGAIIWYGIYFLMLQRA